jgi:acetate kinase
MSPTSVKLLRDCILTINAGSSSLKFAVFEVHGLTCVLSGQVEGLGSTPQFRLRNAAGQDIPDGLHGGAINTHAQALERIISVMPLYCADAHIVAVGHRVVHGGLEFVAPVLIDENVASKLAALSPLAPLHQPHNLAGIAAARTHFPDAAQVACFDTAFHRGQPFVNDAFAIPRSFYDEGVRRYGFHGLSYEYIAGKLGEVAPFHAQGRVIIGHLGSGASMCALRNGCSVASTMGFSALDGLPMGTRPGQIDPGVLLYLMDQKGMDAKAISELLYRQSGLKGLSGISNDMRELEASGHPHARQAIDLFVFRVRREIGGLAAALEGLDAIVFCGGIGENARNIREYVLQGMEWIGVELDLDRNRANAELISSARSRVQVFVIPTNEELMIARHAVRLLENKT